MSKIFGGSKSSSSNRAYDSINSSFSPLFGMASTGADSLMKLLGGDSSGFDAYKKATGFDFASGRGIGAVTAGNAARGLLNSGSTAKGIAEFSTGLQNQYADNYMQRLLGLSDIGLKAGGLVTGAGQTSSSKSKPGIGKFLGQIIGSVAASDRRLKKNIFKIGRLANGLNLYQFSYINNMGPYIGVMADEVAEIQPEALGPVLHGYMTVDYSKISKEL